MKKMPENKPRKATRIILCFLYFFELVLCAVPFYGYLKNGKLIVDSVFATISRIGSNNSNLTPLNIFIPLSFIFIIIPIIAFFVLVFDKQTNIKNIVSLIFSVICIILLIFVVGFNYMNIGAIFALILYVNILQVTILSMMSRLIKSNNTVNELSKEKV